MSDLKSEYENRFRTSLEPLAERLESLLRDLFKGVPRIDRITARAKAIDRFLTKAERRTDRGLKYSDPLNQIQDQIGARIVAFYACDLGEIAKTAETYFHYIERHVIIPDSESEFGYFGQHFIMLLPRDLFADDISQGDAPSFFELQIKSLFQHAWSEANHDLGYKPEWSLSSEDKRKIAFTAAQAWGADMIFDELHRASAARRSASSEEALSGSSQEND